MVFFPFIFKTVSHYILTARSRWHFLRDDGLFIYGCRWPNQVGSSVFSCLLCTKGSITLSKALIHPKPLALPWSRFFVYLWLPLAESNKLIRLFVSFMHEGFHNPLQGAHPPEAVGTSLESIFCLFVVAVGRIKSPLPTFG